MANLTCTVDGDPQPQGSLSVSRFGKVYSANSKLEPWRKNVTAVLEQAASDQHWSAVHGAPHGIDLEFRLAKPKSVKRWWPAVKPDLDKLVRAVWDAITKSGAVDDDGRFVRLEALKVYADEDQEPGVDIEIWMVS